MGDSAVLSDRNSRPIGYRLERTIVRWAEAGYGTTKLATICQISCLFDHRRAASSSTVTATGRPPCQSLSGRRASIVCRQGSILDIRSALFLRKLQEKELRKGEGSMAL